MVDWRNLEKPNPLRPKGLRAFFGRHLVDTSSQVSHLSPSRKRGVSLVPLCLHSPAGDAQVHGPAGERIQKCRYFCALMWHKSPRFDRCKPCYVRRCEAFDSIRGGLRPLELPRLNPTFCFRNESFFDKLKRPVK